MTKNIILFGGLLGIFLFTYPANNANTLAPKTSNDRLVVNLEKNVPPPVRNAFNELLEQIAMDRGRSLSQITNSNIRWSKEKNEYDVVAGIIFGNCQEGGIYIRIDATFTANGELVSHFVQESLCTGLIEF